MKKQFVFLFLPVLFLLACNISPQPINYGEDACHYCTMTIVDHQHAAQIVTDKGKAYKFDAIECMLNYLRENKNVNPELYLVTDFMNPGELIDATKATYLISKNIPSPMGAYLSAFHTKEAADKTKMKYEGKLYTWEEILDYFNK
ncbi:MAG: nitrous oxide reductase accessory protein NosL [Flavobacteriaceae bacterium]|nr:nitrous oxide reductase accessory protein NosL [Flavobacteriaceae bacterium]